MKKHLQNQNGFGHHILLPLLVIAVVGGIGMYLTFASKAATQPRTSTPTPPSTLPIKLKAPFAGGEKWTATTRTNHVGNSDLPTDFNHWPTDSDYGQPVLAPADGTVTGIAWGTNGGNMLTLDHGSKVQTRYGHLRMILVDKGTTVKQGQVIALVGNTGAPDTKPHLHMAVVYNGKYFPIQFDGTTVTRGYSYSDRDPVITSTNRSIVGAQTP